MQVRGKAWGYKEAVDLSPIRMKRACNAFGGCFKRAPCGIRTHDLPLTERVLYQLS